MKFLVVGTVSNCAKSVNRDFLVLFKALSRLGEVEFHLVESDSKDQTIRILDEIAESYTTLTYTSLGQLRDTIPDRIERIRFCRNQYIEYIRKHFNEKKWEYIVVADLDGMNKAIKTTGIKSSLLALKSYDALFANQTFGYYDLLALRCSKWVEGDVIKEFYEAVKQPIAANASASIFQKIKRFYEQDKIRRQKIYNKMVVLRKNEKLIPVDSAFGGLGIYRSKIFLTCSYEPKNSSEIGACEHVALHNRCKEQGFSLAINPKMINAHVNPYILNKLFIIRFMRNVKRKALQSSIPLIKCNREP